MANGFSTLGAIDYIQQQGERGRQRGEQSKLGQLYSQALTAPQSERTGLLAQMAQVNPDSAAQAGSIFSKMDADRRTQFGKFAAVFDALPDEQKAQAYPQFAAQAKEALGLPVPEQWDPAFSPRISQIAQALGSSDGISGRVQSTYIDAQGNRVAIMRDGSTQTLGQNAPSNQIIDTGNGFFGVNKGNLQAAPVMIGGAPQQPAATQAFMAADGTPVRIDPSLPPNVQAAIRQAEQQGQPVPDMAPPLVQAGGGQQLRSQPKPQEQARLDMEAERLRLAQESAGVPSGYRRTAGGQLEAIPGGPADPGAAKPLTAKQRAEVDAKKRKEQQMLGTMESSIDNTVRMIDSLLDKKASFSGITGMGRMGASIPGTKWADLSAKLDTLKARSAFGALQEMRANSPTGGALGSVSERELYLLQNAETQLQNSQSPESLAQSLSDYKRTLLDSKRRMREGVSEFYQAEEGAQPEVQSGSVDDILSKYGIQ